METGKVRERERMTSKATEAATHCQVPDPRAAPSQTRLDDNSNDRQTISDSSTDYLSTTTTDASSLLSLAFTTAADIRATFGYISDRLKEGGEGDRGREEGGEEPSCR